MNSDFSWYDYDPSLTSRDTNITLDGVGYLVLNSSYGTIVDAKTITVTNPLPLNQTYSEFGLGRGTTFDVFGVYGHPVYIHPHCEILFDNFVSTEDTIWLNTSGGKDNPNGNTITVRNCQNINGLQVSNNGPYVYSTDVVIENSRVTFGGIFRGNTLTVKDSYLGSGTSQFKVLKSEGNNEFRLNLTISDQTEFISKYDSFYGTLHFLEGINVELYRPELFHLSRIKAKDFNSVVRVYDAPPRSGMLKNMNGEGTNRVEYIKCHMIKGETYNIAYDTFTIPNQVKFYDSKTSLIVNPSLPAYISLSKEKFLANNNAVSIAVDLNNSIVEKTSFTGVPSYAQPWLRNCVYQIVINPSTESVVKLNGGLQRIEIQSIVDDFRYDYGDCSPFFLYNGLIKLILTEENQLDMFKFYNSYPTTPSYGRVKNCTTTNLNMKTNHREIGEEVTFEFDSKNGRLIEIHSSIQKKYANARPVEKGIHKERLYNSNTEGVY